MKYLLLCSFLLYSSFSTYSQNNPVIFKIKRLKEYRTEVGKMKRWQDKNKQNAEIVLNKVKIDSSLALIQMDELINYHNKTTVYNIYYDPKTYRIVSINKR